MTSRLRRFLSRQTRHSNRGRKLSRRFGMEQLESRALLTIGLPSLVSVNAAGTAAGNNISDITDQNLSADGRYLVFSSAASNLVANDTNNTWDVFLRDLQTGTTTLVSRTASGASASDHSSNGAISADGRYVAFYSDATDLDLSGGPASTHTGQIYRWDRLTGKSVLVSVNATGSDGGWHSFSSVSSDKPSISADGHRIAFESHADDLVSGLTDANDYYAQDVYFRDLTAGTTTLVSHAAGNVLTTGDSSSYSPRISRDGSRVAYLTGSTNLEIGVSDSNGHEQDLVSFEIATGINHYVSTESNVPSTGNADSSRLKQSLSADGRYEVFSSSASDLVQGDIAQTSDVFLRDHQTGTTTLVSRTAEGTSGAGRSYNAVISANGQYVAFSSDAQDLDLSGGPAPTNNAQIYRWDRLTGKSILVSVNSANNGASNSYNDSPSISADGSRIAFLSSSTDLLSGITDNNGDLDVYVRDVTTGSTKLVSRSGTNATTTANNSSYEPRISRDGSTVVYLSMATNLASGVTDSNSEEDLFAYDFAAGTNKAVSVRTTGTTTGNSGVVDFDISNNGQVIAFSSFATNFIAGDTNGTSDVFVRHLSQTGVTRVNVSPAGVQSDNSSESPSISGDGNFVAFWSHSTNFSPLAGSGHSNIYVRDRSSGTTTLITAGDSEGVPVEADGHSFAPRISNDGSTVAFLGNATNLDSSAIDGNLTTDVFVRNWQATSPTTRLVSRSNDGSSSANHQSSEPVLSDNGQRLLFTSLATDLVSGIADVIETTDLFTFDGTNVLLVTQKGVGRFTGRYGVDTEFTQTDDGRLLAYSTSSPGITGDTNQIHVNHLNHLNHVYIVDVTTRSTERVSVNSAEEPSDSASYQPSVSGDGRFVAFISDGSNLSSSWNGQPQIYVRDRTDGNTMLVSVNRLGTAGGNSYSEKPQISRDGSIIAFASHASDLQTGVTDNNNTVDIFVRNWRATNPVTQTASRRSAAATTGNSHSQYPTISEDGRTVAFASSATNLTGISDTNTSQDVFAVRSIGLSVSSMDIVEGNSGATNANFIVSLATPSTQTVTVQYESLDGTATVADNDYTPVSGTLTFNPGQVSKSVFIPVHGDLKAEVDESFTLRLFNATNADIFVPTGTGTILSDDGEITATDADVNEGNSGTTTLNFTVALFPANTAQTVTLDYTTANGTATAGSDYLATSGTLAFAPGETVKTVSVTIYGDTDPESFETVQLLLSNASNAVIRNPVNIGTINNDDTTICVSDATVVEGNFGSSTTGVFVSLSHASVLPVTVHLATVDGTATVADSDYSAISTTLTFNPLDTLAYVGLAVNGDTKIEPDEFFLVKLSASTNATIAEGVGDVMIQTDDLAGFSFDFGAVSSDLHPSLRYFGSSNSDHAPFQIIRYGRIVLTSLSGFAQSLAAAGHNPENITIEFGSDNPANPVEVITLDSFDDGVADGIGNQNYRPNGSLTPDGTQADDPTITVFNAGVAVASGVFEELNLQLDGTLTSLHSVIRLTSPFEGNDTTIFDEVMLFTNGTGLITFSLDEFDFRGSDTGFGDSQFFFSTGQGLGGSELFDDHGDTWPNATGWDRLTPIAGRMNTDTDVDTFAVNLEAGRTYTFGTILKTLGDSKLALLNAAGTEVAVNDDFGGTTASQLTYTVPTSDTYFLVVDGFGGSLGSYLLEQRADVVLTPAVNLSVSANSGSEAEGTVILVTATADAPVIGDQTVAVSVSGTGITGSDFVFSASLITILDGQTSGSITFTIEDDLMHERDETAILTIANPTAGITLGPMTTQDVTIVDNDPVPVISINDVNLVEGDGGLTAFEFIISLSNPSAFPVSVSYATTDGTASVGSDYRAASGSVTFDPGQTWKAVVVDVEGDFLNEVDETFFVDLSNATEATLGVAQGLATIINDDAGNVPSAVNDYFNTDKNTPRVETAPGVLGNDADPNRDMLTVTALNGSGAGVGSHVPLPSGALLTLNSDGSFVYDPNGQFNSLSGGQSATDSFSYTVSDLAGNTSTAMVTMTINGVADDTIPPSSNVVQPADSRVTATNFSINIVGRDTGPNASGIDRFDLYVRTNVAGAFVYFATVPAVPGAPAGQFTATTSFTGSSNTTYQFASVAIDKAGNREPGMIRPDALYRVGDIDAPVSQVNSVVFDPVTGMFSVNFSGADIGGTIRTFDVFVSVDGAVPVQVGSVRTSVAGSARIAAVTGTHSYRFFTVATDHSGNVEATPAAPGDVTLTATFNPPGPPQLVDFDVQNGATQRSFINELNMQFSNEDGFDDFIAARATRIQLVNTGLNGFGNSVVDISDATLLRFGRQLTLNLGDGGLQTDGVYELRLDLDNNGSFETVRRFHRIQGDADGDGDTDLNDLMQIRQDMIFQTGNPSSDVNGDGVVNALDYVFAARSFGALLDPEIRRALDD